MAEDLVAAGSFFAKALKALHPFESEQGHWFDGRHPQAQFLNAVLSLSPFLRDLFLHNPYYLEPLSNMSLNSRLDRLLAEIAAFDTLPEMTETRLMQQLRLLKREAHGLIALGDLSTVFDGKTTTAYLSRLAEARLGSALRFLLRDLDRAGKVTLPYQDEPERGSGLIILAMGKLGANELNYSSDVDLVVFIDEQVLPAEQVADCVDIYSRLIRRLVRIMQERTVDGYVFRMDLRLRPDPASTPLALPVGAALRYYEARGQNWERAALIKARPVAGDIAAGERFLHELVPYIWRKYLDYAAIADIHSIKRQIHTCKGHGAIAVRGHNIKLGRGGIREIEFFVQTQQLIAGGRFAQLRGRNTVEMLAALCETGWIAAPVADSLRQHYVFLRHVEHRIQMVADEQTHILPEDEDGFLRVAYLTGYTAGEAFTRDMLAALHGVEEHYAALFEHERDLASAGGNLVFTGGENDPETLATLSGLGFTRPADICRIIRSWHSGRTRAMRSREARERLTELTPALLQAFGATVRADDAFMRFDTFLQGLPAGIQLFSLLQSNPALLEQLVLIMSAAPRLAEIIMRKPHVFDSMLAPQGAGALPERAALAGRLRDFVAQAADYEEILDRLRIFAAEQRFLIGVRLLGGAIDGVRAGAAFTVLAEVMLDVCLQAVEAEFARQHGRIAGGRVALLGMGKLGSGELTAGSDLDLILLYDHAADVEMSDGRKPLYAAQYYARLAQRLVAALSAPSGEGVLYEVDLRLRPSGNKGPVAVDFAAFGQYQRHEAWTWEHMALTRARAIAGDTGLQAQLMVEIAQIIGSPRDNSKIADDVRAMRAMIAREKPAHSVWDMKTMAGGLIDLDFIAQYAVLTRKSACKAGASAGEILAGMGRSDLLAAWRLYSDVEQIMRLCLMEVFSPDDMPAGLADLLARSAGEPDVARLQGALARTAAEVRAAFAAMIGTTAAEC
ncbi:MAG: Glutamate-ammonia-ligase adenylyltransferase [Candidatus Tokpelaia hoelldobleri]|uniref:Bifunctional glutamine synthetase adenylyltransferase/adenylyl-removing enzyme n=1 Tax=Candidatus Tokpelaia hoelldobleri TaxID=1902579 RepID=A0A1U9JVY3_9HYPH|nr:MAG: Glutamate-ammonia-ligase adenylyltransferase [Candidatus Tokpelaia hoelldoblerii]